MSNTAPNGAAAEAAIVIDRDGRIVEWTAGAERLFGYSRSEALGQPVEELVIPEVLRPAHQESVDRLLAGGKPRILGRSIAVPAVRADGSQIRVELRVTRASDDPVTFATSVRQLPGEGRRPTGAERHLALLDASEELGGTGSWEWTPAEADFLWSDNLFRMFGLAPAELAPTPDYVVARTLPEDRELAEAAFAALETSGRIEPLDLRIVRVDGVVRHLLVDVAVTEWRGSRPHRIVGLVQDLTDRRRAEREIAAHIAVAEALTEWDSFESGSRRLLAALAGAMDYAAGVFWVPRKDVLSAPVLWRADSVDLREFEAATARLRLPRGVGLPGRAWEQRKPLAERLTGEPAAMPREQAAAREGLREAVVIPAMSGGEVLAVVELLSAEQGELEERLMRSLTGIGYELGQFLARRRGELEPAVLTPREIEVLELAAQGLSARRSAERLGVSAATVRTHLENIYAKLGVTDKASAVADALRQGLIR